MRKEQRIKKNPEFQAVFKKGTSMANRQFVLYRLKKQDQTMFRLGLSVSKKVGNAVMRVQVKRYIRQVFLELSNELDPSYDYVVIARKPAADLNFHETKKSLTHVMKKARVLKSENSKK
ncbi:ribonuclease P [Jeotgalibacillus alimentarius]|uniref:Ribonuclease P protein component n=1 Tax=Jeotgalibacillus alimentarius TaxID=135826 RepID=A0A0C2VFV8_9BACL|nr:ribonuclease P protein component [Jeotgalibacillus alimentarius]KIL42888.1 ribonuclease P [Jeotgalibacillus alimentarius]